MKKLQSAAALSLGAGLTAALAWYYDVYVHWQPGLYPFAVAAVLLGNAMLTLLVLRARGERKAPRFLWKTLLSTAVSAVFVGAVTFLINNVIGHESMARQAAAVALPLCCAQILALFALLLRAMGKKRGLRTGLALAGVILAALAAVWFAGRPAPPLALDTETPLPDDYALWEVRTREELAVDLSETLVSADSGALAWGTSYAVNAMCRAYQATGERIYLERPAGYLYEIFRLAADNNGDGYKNWGTGHYSGDAYEEFCVHTGALLSSAGELVNLIYSVPDMLEETEPVSGMAYAALCEYLAGEATGQMIPAFDGDWDEAAGVYVSPPGNLYFDGERVSLPNNQFLAMAAALIQFAKLSPEHEELYLHRAEAMLDAFRSKLKYDNGGGITKWNYRDSYFKGDRAGGTEDFSHGMWGVRAALLGHANGMAFTGEDIGAFARKYSSLLRGTQEEPLLAYNMDGTGTADNALYLFVYDLSPFGSGVWRAGYKTAVFRGAAANVGDTARILAYHEHAPVPQAFAPLSPAPGSRVAGRALFRWEASPRACKYTLQISAREDFSDLLIDRPGILDTSAFVEGLPAGGTFHWRVTAANQGGGEYVSDIWKVLT